MLGVVVTAAIAVAAYAMISGKGNIAESSALFAYIVYSSYMTMTDYGVAGPATKPEYDPFPPLVMESYVCRFSLPTHRDRYATVVSSAAQLVPVTLSQIYAFVVAALAALTPSLITSFVYRISVLYAASRIIPAARDSARGIENTPSMEDEEPSANLMSILVTYSPCMLIGVYTHLLMQHFNDNAFGKAGLAGLDSGPLWRWVNALAVLALYSVELSMGDEDNANLTAHWKVE